jgi:hypothetical protein
MPLLSFTPAWKLHLSRRLQGWVVWEGGVGGSGDKGASGSKRTEAVISTGKAHGACNQHREHMSELYDRA